MTADAAEIVRLATLVEQATKPDRELDKSVHNDVVFADWMWDGDVPHYTSSLDAAMTLVPDGWPVIDLCTDAGTTWRCDLGMVTKDGIYESENQMACAYGETPALALTAAALRARAAQHDHEVG